MNEIAAISESVTTNMNELDIVPTVFNFCLCLLMAFVIKGIYQRYSFSLTGKTHIGAIIPVLAGIVFMIIVVVKSSLALSLGLVGALSIVRFRTAIKEPEELVYLFLAITIGLGYAAGHVFVTTLLTLLLICVILLWASNRSIQASAEGNLILNWSDFNLSYEDIVSCFPNSFQSPHLIRLDAQDDSMTAVLAVTPTGDSPIASLIEQMKRETPGVQISFVEANTKW